MTRPKNHFHRLKSMWKDQFLASRDLVSQIPLRHGMQRITADLISSQLYCEMKAELRLQLPEPIQREVMLDGLESEEKAIPKVEATRHELMYEIESGKLVGVKFNLVAQVAQLVYSGTPDLIYFYEGIPRILIEYK